MERCWYLLIEGKREGPYSIEQLKKHPKINPLTLVWKKGFSKWVPIGSVTELSFIVEKNKKFPDQRASHPPLGSKEVGVLVKPNEFHPSPVHWLLFFLIVIVLFFLVRYWMR